MPCRVDAAVGAAARAARAATREAAACLEAGSAQVAWAAA